MTERLLSSGYLGKFLSLLRGGLGLVLQEGLQRELSTLKFAFPFGFLSVLF